MRRLIGFLCVGVLATLCGPVALPASAAAGNVSFCDTGTGFFQVDGTGFAHGVQLLVWTGWDATAGIGSDTQTVTTDATGKFSTTFPSSELPTTVEVTDANYNPVAGPFSAGAISPCSTAAGQPSLATSTVVPSVNPPQLPADGLSQTVVTVQLRNADNVPLTVGGQTVTVSTTAGSFAGGCQTSCPAHDNGDGTYTATLTAPTAPATGTITAYLNGTPIRHTATVTFTQLVLDPPSLTGPTGLSTAAVATFTFSGRTGTTFLCSLDGAPYTSCTSPYTTSALADGQHTFGVEQTLVGVTSQAATDTWTVSTPPPAPTIGSTPASLTNQTSATFSFSGAASGTTYACSLDNAAFAACTSPVTYTGLAAGAHTFSVEEVKATGVTGASTSFSWSIDTTPPAAPTLTATPAGSSTASFSFTDEAGATFRCSLDGAAYSTCVSGVTYTSLAVGSHTFSVEAVDAAGNVGPATTYAFTVTQVVPSCNRAGAVAAAQSWKYGSGRSAELLSVIVYADCDLDRATGNVVLDHALVAVWLNGQPVVDAAPTNATLSGCDALLTGDYKQVPFTVTLHDGGLGFLFGGSRSDTIRVQYGSLDTSTLSTTHGDVLVATWG